MKTLPLFYYPSTWVWVDDNHTLLHAMADNFSKICTVKLFESSEDCLKFLNNYTSLLLQYNFLQSDLSDENYGQLTKTPMNFDVTQIARLRENKQRHHEITVAIVDYQMPTMNGLELAEKMQPLAVQKILLTGNIKEMKAVEGFNNNLIQKFVQKASTNMLHDLSKYATELSYRYFEYVTKPLLTYIEAEKKIALSDPTFIDFFEEYCKKNLIAEYYLIDNNGSFVCFNAKGEKSFLIVHTDKSIANWLSMYKNELSFSTHNREEVNEHKKIPFFGIGKEAWEISADEWEKYLHPATMITGREQYFIATLNEKNAS